MTDEPQGDKDTEKSSLLLKAMALHITEHSMNLNQRMMEEHSASFRWLMASLLALNSGGLFFLKDAIPFNSCISIVSACSFFVGISLSLMVAVMGQKAIQNMLAPSTKLAIYWRSVALTGEQNEAMESAHAQEMDEANKTGRWPRRIGFASFFFFSLGILLAVWGMMEAAKVNERKSDESVEVYISHPPHASR